MGARLPLEAFTGWLANGERGISSEAIVSHLTGVQVGRSRAGDDHPHDPADLRRCELLLRRVPLAEVAFPAMASRSLVWAALVDAWSELVTFAESEGVFTDGYWRARRTYARMRELIDSARGGDSA